MMKRLIFILILHYLCLIFLYLTVAASNDCNNLKTHLFGGSETKGLTKATVFCNHWKDLLEISSQNNSGNKEAGVDGNGSLAQCTNSIQPYFAKYKETDDAVDKFAEKCKTLYRGWNDCVNMINHLNKYCYSMADAHELLKDVSNEELQNLGGYAKIVLKQQDWNKYQKTKAVNIKNCLQEFSERPKSDSNNSKEISAVDIMEKYSDWYKRNKNGQCSCVEIFGVYTIYEASSKTSPAITESTLSYFYDQICLQSNINREVWKKHHFIGFAKSVKSISNNVKIIKDVELFLKECDLIADYWCNPKYENSKWPFDYLTEVLELSYAEVQKDRLKTLGYAMRANLSADDFKNIVSLTSDVEEINTPECRYSVLQTIYELDKYQNGRKDTEAFVAKTAVWQFSNHGVRKTFQMFMKIFKHMYHTHEVIDPCYELTSMMKKFEDLVKSTKSNELFVNEILKKAIYTGRDFFVFTRCLKFCERVSEGVLKYFRKTLPKEKLENLLRNVLSIEGRKICHPSFEEYDVSNEENLKKVLTSILKEDIGKIIQ